MKQIKSENVLKSRKALGLSEKTTDLKDNIVAPTTAYISNPPVVSKSELIEKLKADNVF